MVFPPWLAYLLLCPAVEGGCWYMGGSDDYTNQLGQSRQPDRGCSTHGCFIFRISVRSGDRFFSGLFLMKIRNGYFDFAALREYTTKGLIKSQIPIEKQRESYIAIFAGVRNLDFIVIGYNIRTFPIKFHSKLWRQLELIPYNFEFDS